MGRHEKLLLKILSGRSDSNISFTELCNLLTYLGFNERIRGSHHIFNFIDMDEILNLQPNDGKAKPYQVKQVRNIIIKYKLNTGD